MLHENRCGNKRNNLKSIEKVEYLKHCYAMSQLKKFLNE